MPGQSDNGSYFTPCIADAGFKTLDTSHRCLVITPLKLAMGYRPSLPFALYPCNPLHPLSITSNPYSRFPAPLTRTPWNPPPPFSTLLQIPAVVPNPLPPFNTNPCSSTSPFYTKILQWPSPPLSQTSCSRSPPPPSLYTIPAIAPPPHSIPVQSLLYSSSPRFPPSIIACREKRGRGEGEW